MVENENKNNEVTEEGAEMTFWEHLEELRWTLVRSVAAVVVLAIAAFLNKDFLFNNIILAPKSSDFITNRWLCELGKFISENLNIASAQALCIENFDLKLINIKMAGQFSIHISISFFTGIVLAIPYIIYEIWRFVKPALHPHEQAHTRGAVFWTSSLFLIGVLFSYFLIVPLSVLFLGSYNVSENVENQIALTSYISTVVSLTFAVGLVFEMPILVFFLTKVGIITPNFMRKNRRVMIVVVLIVAAIITPPDVFSQILVSIPLLLLYEISILISKRVYKRRMARMAG